MTSLAEHVEAEAYPHLAVFLRGPEELPQVLASFYALAAAGLDVAGLEAADRLVVVEMDFTAPAEGSADPWQEKLDAAIGRGCTGLWYARFPVDPASEDHEAMLAFEREWHRMSRNRPVVTLCPFIVGELDGGAAVATLGEVAATHTGVLVPDGAGDYSLLRPG